MVRHRRPDALYVDATSPGTATLRATFTPTTAGIAPQTADAKVTIVKLDISPNSGPLGTKVTVKMIPAGLNLLTSGTTISGTGKFCPVPASLGDSGETTVTHPADKVNTEIPDEASIVIGDVKLSFAFETENSIRFAKATGGVCRLSKVEIATPSGRKFAIPFDFTPLCFSGTLEICTMATDANGMEIFTPSSTFNLGQKLYIQSEIGKVVGVTPPASLIVRIQSLDANGDLVVSPEDYSPTSHLLILQKVGENGDKYVYRSDSATPVVPWNVGGLSLGESALGLYFVNDGSVEVKYEYQ